MTTVAKGPYEHAGPYVDSEFFDTTGTPPGFCRCCEHAPCVAGLQTFCTMQPRFIVSAAIRKETFDLLDRVDQSNPLLRVMVSAVHSITLAARGSDVWAESALDDLAEIRRLLRELVA
ncbi:MAG TPA: hypothetical protein VIP28_13205 [Nocardioides sp.]